MKALGTVQLYFYLLILHADWLIGKELSKTYETYSFYKPGSNVSKLQFYLLSNYKDYICLPLASFILRIDYQK